jgi:cbb3-type cytochrome oxidase cytochrome c subunit
MEDPRSTSPGSVMPAYPHMLGDAIDFDVIQNRIDAMVMLGVPYGKAALDDAAGLARTQAKEVADKLRAAGGPENMADKEIVAMIAYLQRLGVDIRLSQEGAK